MRQSGHFRLQVTGNQRGLAQAEEESLVCDGEAARSNSAGPVRLRC